MVDGKISFILGILFLIAAIILIYMQKGISIWTGLLIVLSILDIITGIVRMKKEQ